MFKTQASRKDADARVMVEVYCNDRSLGASARPPQTDGKFRSATRNTVDLNADESKTRGDIKGGYHKISIEPIGTNPWTFSYILTLNFLEL